MPRSRSPSSRKGRTSHRRSRSSSRRHKTSSHLSPERSHRSHSKSSLSKHKRSGSRHRYQKHRSKSPYRSERRSSYDRRRRRSSSSSSSSSTSSSSSSTSNSRNSSRSSRSNHSGNVRSRLPAATSKKKQNKINLETTPTHSQSQPCFKSAMEYLDAPVMPETIDAIDADSFVPATFTSNANKTVSQKFVINLSSETVSVPKLPVTDPQEDPIFHYNVIQEIIILTTKIRLHLH